MTVRDQLRRSPTARALYRRGRLQQAALLQRVLGSVDFEKVPDAVAVRLMYQVLLGRNPDPGGYADNLHEIAVGNLTRDEMADFMRGSEEFQNRGFSARTLGPAIHAGRCQFVRSLPPARHIVDLGGTHKARDIGAMVALGYPYPFEQLTIVDLPSDDRHALYRSDDRRSTVQSDRGPVSYRYHSMTDLSGFEDESIDLVYSGQSIEHVSEADGASVLAQVRRILRPGGYMAIDTPNGRVTRMQQAEFIDPDHEVEYTWPQLRDLVGSAGFEIFSAAGLNYGGEAVRQGRFDMSELARHPGLHHVIEDCYILAVVIRKPA